MTLRQLYRMLATVLLSVLLLALLWEFWLEPNLLSWLDQKPESLGEQWEYVLTIMAFVLVSLLYPAVVGRRLILQQQDAHQRVTHLAEEDYLTRLYNRRKLTESLEQEIKRFRRYQTVFSVVLLDIDHFKETNDTFGHSVGDKLLVELSDMLQLSCRAPDIVGRWGGEEFLIICAETDLEGSAILAEKIRLLIESTEFDEIGFKTCSFGVAEARSGDDADSLLRRVDRALYAAKTNGRNRVELAE
jgi:diguanylate cyclase (GGDEF)-like protein